MRKKNVKLWNHLTTQLKDFKITAGWFENTRYDAETPVAGIAAVQNFGTVAKPIEQNVTEKQRKFLHLIGIHLKKTTEKLYIVIPPRPFMDKAKERIKGPEGKEILAQELLRVFEGKQTMEQAANRLGLWVQSVIQEEIKAITSPPLKTSTIKTREKSYKSKSKNQSTKPLGATGIMYDTVQHQVTIK